MARPVRATAVLAARTAALAAAVVVVTAVALGWLYWLRAGVAGWPGPRVSDALPLDELPAHDSIPLSVYAAVFAAGGVLLGLAARALRLDRLTAGLGLAVGTGLWLLVVDGFCLFVVRQVGAGEALRAAARLQAVYLAAALSGAGGALLGRRGARAAGRAPRLLGWLIAAGGLADLVSALAPRTGAPLGLLVPSVVSPAAHVLLVPAGVLLLITSRALTRRSRRAWRLAAALLGLSVLLHLARGPRYAAATVTGLVAVALVARRADFPFHGDPAARPSAMACLAGGLALAVGYGLVADWAYRIASDLPVSFWSALTETLRAMGGQLLPRDAGLLPAGFATCFPLSVLSIAAIAIIRTAAIWLRPWQHLLFADHSRGEHAAAIVRRWGADTLAPFALRLDKDWFITGQTLIAYRVIRGIALISGDPVGPPAQTPAALASFLARAQARGWRTAVLGASGRSLLAYRDLGLHPLYHGDEAVIDTRSFSLGGRRMRTVRQAVHRLERRGFRANMLTAGQVLPALRAELEAVEHAWLHGGARKGFTMELDSLFRLGGDDAVFVIGRDPQHRVQGFLHLAACPASQSLSLSAMPRRPATPNGFTAWLITAAVSWASARGYQRLSLNFAPFAGLLARQHQLPPVQRLQRRALLRLKKLLALQLDNLLRFNNQFDPAWQPRYVIVQAWADLPRVVLAAMAAEGYLPHARLTRRRRSPVPAPALTQPETGGRPPAGQAPQARPEPGPASTPASGQAADCPQGTVGDGALPAPLPARAAPRYRERPARRLPSSPAAERSRP
jgi:lysyl-tRNA synthetase class 2